MLLSSAEMVAAPHPKGSDGEGLFVRLELLWTVLMSGERIQYHYILENASNKPTPVAIPYLKRGFGFLEGGQPFLEALPDIFYHRDIFHVSKAQWPPKTQFDEEMEAWSELSPGEKLTLNQNRLIGSSFGVSGRPGLESIRAHWLAGKNKWVSSAPMPVKVVIVPRSLRKEVFEAKWSSYGYGKDLCQEVGYTAPIENRFFLFFGNTRVAEVEPDDEFEHVVDEHGTNLAITIKNSTGSRKVYYHLRHGLVGDTPWPIGPVKLFYPKPEPIPPAELEALRKRIKGRNHASAGTRRAGKKQRSKPNSLKPNKDEADERNLIWFIAFLLLIAALIAIFIYARKRK